MTGLDVQVRRLVAWQLGLWIVASVAFAVAGDGRGLVVLTGTVAVGIFQLRGLGRAVRSLSAGREPAERSDRAEEAPGAPEASGAGSVILFLGRYAILAASLFILIALGRDRPWALVAGLLITPSALIAETIFQQMTVGSASTNRS